MVEISEEILKNLPRNQFRLVERNGKFVAVARNGTTIDFTRMRFGVYELPQITSPVYTCEVCLTRVNRLRRMNADNVSVSVTWMHGKDPEDAHEVVVAREEDVPARLLCDFCLAYDPVWIMGCKDFSRDPRNRGSVNTGRLWAACPDCYEVITADNQERMIGRMVGKAMNDSRVTGLASEIRSDVADQAVRESLKELFELFQENRQPELDRQLDPVDV